MHSFVQKYIQLIHPAPTFSKVALLEVGMGPKFLGSGRAGPFRNLHGPGRAGPGQHGPAQKNLAHGPNCGPGQIFYKKYITYV